MSARPDLPSLPSPPQVFPCPDCGRTFTHRAGSVMHRCVDGQRILDGVAAPSDIAGLLQGLRHNIVLDVLTDGDPWREANPELYRVIR